MSESGGGYRPGWMATVGAPPPCPSCNESPVPSDIKQQALCTKRKPPNEEWWVPRGLAHFLLSEWPKSTLACSKSAIVLIIFSGTSDVWPEVLREAGGTEPGGRRRTPQHPAMMFLSPSPERAPKGTSPSKVSREKELRMPRETPPN